MTGPDPQEARVLLKQLEYLNGIIDSMKENEEAPSNHIIMSEAVSNGII